MSLEKIHIECKKIFFEKLLEAPGSRSFACEIYDAMIQGSEDYENCIGENFNQLIQNLVGSWFNGYVPNDSTRVEFYTYTYIFWLYLFLERIEFIINQVDPDRKFGPIVKFHRSLKTMNEIRLWANFIKHPKNFIFVHWPHFTFVGKSFQKEPHTIIINTSFLKNHYSSENQDKPKELENKSDVVVQFPKLANLTLGFCEELLKFVDFICKNQLIADELKKKSNRKK